MIKVYRLYNENILITGCDGLGKVEMSFKEYMELRRVVMNDKVEYYPGEQEPKTILNHVNPPGRINTPDNHKYSSQGQGSQRGVI